MREIETCKVIVYRRIEFERGSLIEGLANHHTLKIAASPPYEYSNWTKADLADLRDTISRFLDVLEVNPRSEEQKKANI